MQAHPPYHHGDLPAALLAATGALIDEEGVGGVSIRAVARRVGVSHAAPAHHFRDKTGLLTAYATEGFRHFAEHLERGRTSAPPAHPQERLAACGSAYLAFAREHRAWFSVLFRPELHDAGDQALEVAGAHAFGILVGAVADCLQEPDEHESRRLALSAWATVHGLAALTSDGPLATGGGPAGPELSQTDVEASVLDILLAGLRAQPSWDPTAGIRR